MNKKRYIIFISFIVFVITVFPGFSSTHNAKHLIDSAAQLYSSTKYKQAIDLYAYILENYEDSISNDILGGIYVYYADCLYLISDYTKADDYITKLLKLKFSEINIKYRSFAHGCFINGNVASISGDYKKAIDYYEKSWKYFKLMGAGEFYKMAIYNNIAVNYMENGEYEKALNIFLSYTDRSDLIQNPQFVKLYVNIAKAYSHLEDTLNASHYYSYAVDYATENLGADHGLTLHASYNYAAYLSRVGEADKARNIFMETRGKIELLTKDEGYQITFYKSLGEFYLHMKEPKPGLEALQKALIEKIPNFTDTNYYHQVLLDESIIDLELLEILKVKAELFQIWYANSGDIQYLTYSNQTYKNAAELTEKLKHKSQFETSKYQILSNQKAIYLTLISQLYEFYNKTGEEIYKNQSYVFTEKIKYAVTSEILYDKQYRKHTHVAKDLLREEESIKIEIGYYQQLLYEESYLDKPDSSLIKGYKDSLFVLNSKREGLLKKLDQSYPVYKKIKYSNLEIIPEEIQKYLSRKDALIEYIVTDTILYSFVFTRRNFQIHKTKLDDRFFNALNELIYQLDGADIQSILEQQPASYIQPAYYLYAILLQPYESLIKNKHITIIPDGMLAHLPFEALVYNNSTDYSDFNSLPYVVKKHRINYDYSGSIFMFFREGSIKREQLSFLSIIPSTERDGLISLAGKEAYMGAELFEGDILEDNNCSKFMVLSALPDYTMAHFATHGVIDTLNPLFSYLILSEKDSAINRLYAHEIYNFYQVPDLIVLAACYSGAGKFQTGEGILSIARAFRLAGSESVVNALWTASDKYSEQILGKFYMNLKKGFTKDKALRKAKTDFLKEASYPGAHPHFWACFINIGSAAPLKNRIGFSIITIISILIIFSILGYILRKKREKINSD